MQVSNRVFWAGVFLLGCSIVSLGAYAGQGVEPLRHNGTIYARRFVLTDEAGHDVAILSSPDSDNHLGPELTFYNPGSQSSTLAIGLKGLKAFGASAGDKGQPYISLSDAKSDKLQIHLSADADVGPALFLKGIKDTDSFSDLLFLSMNPLKGPAIEMFLGKKKNELRVSGPLKPKAKSKTAK